MRIWIAITVGALGCGTTNEPAPVASGSTTPSGAATSTHAPAAAQPRLRTDRPPVRLGGPATWGTASDVVAMRFCPGDQELVSLDATGRVHRYGAADSAEQQVTTLAGNIAPGDRITASIDCRADGTALALDANRSPVLVDRAGKLVLPPSELAADAAKFAPDGSVRVLTGEAILTWRGADVSELWKPHAHALDRGLGEGGVYLERRFNPDKARSEGVWLRRDDGQIKLPGELFDLMDVSVAPDGAVAALGMMSAHGWVVKGKRAGKQILLLDQSGTSVRAAAATNQWFVAVSADGDIWKGRRPGMRWDHIEHPCGEFNYLTAIAITGDDARIAVACPSAGIRIFDLARNQQLSTDQPNSAAAVLAWSPSGARLATLGEGGTIRLWPAAGAVIPAATVATEGASTVWWTAPAELVGLERNDVVRWTLPGGRQDGKPAQHAERMAVGAHGEIVLASRIRGRDGDALTIVRGDQVKTLEVAGKAEWLNRVAISPDGKRAVISRGQYNGKPGTEIVEVDLAAGTAAPFPAPTTAVAIGDAIYVAVPFRGIERRDGATSTPITEPGAEITALAVAGDLIFAGGADGAITIWSTTPKAPRLGRLVSHTGPVTALAVAPDGVHLASSASDGTRIWDLTR